MWLKNLRQRKLQTVLMFLIIAICTTLLAGALSILTSLDQPSQDFARKCNTASAKIYPYYTTASDIQTMGNQFLKLKDVKKVLFVNSHTVEEPFLVKGKKEEVFFDLSEYNDEVFGSDIYLEGNRNVAKQLKEDECILPACISNKYDVHKGDTITIQFAEGDYTYKVAGVYTDPYQTDAAFDSNILVKKLPSFLNEYYLIFVYGKNNITGNQIQEAYLEKYGGIMNAYYNSLEDRIKNGLTVGHIMGALFLAIGVIMLFVSALMIRYMIKNTMLSDAKSIAVYETIGYTVKDILLMYLKFYFFIITLGCCVGIVCSVFVSNSILTSTFRNMGQLRTNNSVLSGVISYLIIVSFVMLVIAVNIIKIRRIKPVETLNGIEYGGIKKKRSYKGNSSIQFSAFGIAYRNFMREKRNAVSIIITCMVTIFSVNFIIITLDVANTMKENNYYWIGFDKSDVMVVVPDDIEFDKVKRIVEEDKRTDFCVSSYSTSTVRIKWQKGINETFMSAFVYEDYKKAVCNVIEGRNPEAGNEIAITTVMAKNLHKSIGDYITVYLDDSTSTNLLITGFFQSYMQFGRVCRLTGSAYQEKHVDFGYNYISVYLKDRKNIDAFIHDIKARINPSCNVKKRTQESASIMDMVSVPQQKAIPPVAVLIMLMAGVNIFCIIYLKNLRTQKVNGIYKSIGYTTWHLISSNLCYVMAIALISVGIIYPVSYYTYSPIVKMSLAMFSFTQYPIQFNRLHILLADAVILVVFILSTLASSKELYKVSARDLVQE